jgi:Putative Ig domain
VRAQDLTVGGTAFGGATPNVVVSGGPSTYTVAVSGMTTSGGITVDAPAGIVDDAWAQLNTVSSNDPTVQFTFAVPPKFQSANNASFTVGSLTTFTADANGGQPAPVPTPVLSISSGSLPSGLTFHDNGNGTASIAGKPAAGTGGVVGLTLRATNFAGTATQPFTLTILEAPTINSAPTATFTVGSASTFNITTAQDYPLPHVTIPAGSLPAGVTFNDNLNGTATISGTAAAGDGGTYTFIVTASNGIAPNAVQPFTLTINDAASSTSSPTTVPPSSGSPTTVPPSSGSPTTVPPSSGSPTTVPSPNGSPVISSVTTVGSTLSFALNEAARVTVTFTKRVVGRKVNRKCVAQTRSNRHERVCKRTSAVGTISFNGHTGRNRRTLQTVLIDGLRLRRGRYAVIITATNPATGKQSQPQRLSFTIVR